MESKSDSIEIDKIHKVLRLARPDLSFGQYVSNAPPEAIKSAKPKALAVNHKAEFARVSHSRQHALYWSRWECEKGV